MIRIIQETAGLLRGAYDLHTHPLPSHVARSLDDWQLLEQAEQAGMAGVLLKNHYEPTGARAALVNRLHPGYTAKAYGAAVLNWPLGGLNPYAVYSALQMGAKIIFFPTRDASQSLLYGDMPGDFFRRPGISLLDDAGALRREVYEIFDVVKQYGALLATGHISPKESWAVCRAGRGQGVRMVLTHPEWGRTVVPRQLQAELAGLGVYLEKCWLNLAEGDCAAEDMMANIRAAGVRRCFLSTDRGQAGQESPVQAMEKFLAVLLRCGLSIQEIRTMSHEVPEEMLEG